MRISKKMEYLNDILQLVESIKKYQNTYATEINHNVTCTKDESGSHANRRTKTIG